MADWSSGAWSGTGSGGNVNFQQAYYNDNPDVAYRDWLNQVPGLGIGQDPRSRFYQQQYGRLYQNYQTQVPQRGPDYTFTNYLGEQGNQLQAQYQALAPQARGLSYADYLGHPRYLW